MKKYEEYGTWWNSREIELIKKDGKIYALNGWNGEEYTDCWEVGGKYETEIIKEGIYARPIYEEIDKDEYETIDYKITDY